MNAFNLILITSGKKSEATAHIWVVSIDGRPHSKVYCKSPYKAMRYAFLLKKRTGLNISDNCLTRVSHEIARAKAAATAPADEPIEVNVDEPLIPPAAPKPTKKPARKRTAKKAKASA